MMSKQLETGEYKEFIDDIVDIVEAKFEAKLEANASAVQYKLALQMISALRMVSGIPDDIGGDED